MTDLRATYWLEADRNIREAGKYDQVEYSYLLNLLAAAVNALMASVPQDVIEEAMASREATQRRVQGGIKKNLKGT